MVLFLLSNESMEAMALEVNVQQFGATGNDMSDDTEAILTAIESLKRNSPPRILYIPPGTYFLSRGAKHPGATSSIDLPSDCSVTGDSLQETILKINPSKTYGVTRLISIKRARNVQLINITFNGSSSEVSLKRGFATQMHAVFVQSSTNISFENCSFVNTLGDGIGINGPDTPSTNICIFKCRFSNNNRNGITLGSGYDGVSIQNSSFRMIKVQPVDSEPQKGECKRVCISQNEVFGQPLQRNLITLCGYKGHIASNFTVTYNQFFDCGIYAINADNAIITDNRITLSSRFSGKAAIYLLGANNKFQIQRNMLETSNVPSLLIIGTAKYGNSRDIIFSKNDVSITSTDFNAIQLQDVGEISIEANRFLTPKGGKPPLWAKGINIRPYVCCVNNKLINSPKLFDNSSVSLNNVDLIVTDNQLEKPAVTK